MPIKLAGSIRISATLATMLALCASFAARADEEYSRTVPADPKGQVEISTFAGLVEVIGWDQPQIEIKGTLSGAIERVNVVSDRGRASIRVEARSGGEANLRIKVPKNSELEVTAVSADIHSREILGEQRLKSVSGDIDASVYGSDVEAKTVSGDTRLHGNRQAISVRATSISGDINYDGGAGDLEGGSVSGSLEASLSPGNDIRVRTTSGDVTLTGKLGGRASIDSEAISGGLTVHMKSEDGYRYEVSSFSGDIENCFNATAERTSRYGPGSRMSGTRGEGKGEVRLKTMSGDIDLCDR